MCCCIFSNSLSLSEDEQNNDTLSIKPPQPQAEYSVEEKARRHREQRSSYNHSLGHSSSSKTVKRSKFSKEEKKDLRKGDGRERESKYEDRHHAKETRREDLRERLERDRRSRKSKDVDVYYESRDVDGRRQHELKGVRKNGRRQTKPDSDEIEDVKQDPKEVTDVKDISKRKKPMEHSLVVSSPEDDIQYKHEKSRKITEEHSKIQLLSEDVTDEGKLI